MWGSEVIQRRAEQCSPCHRLWITSGEGNIDTVLEGENNKLINLQDRPHIDGPGDIRLSA